MLYQYRLELCCKVMSIDNISGKELNVGQSVVMVLSPYSPGPSCAPSYLGVTWYECPGFLQ